jgi:glucose/arabinose dehydrogenase
VSASDGQISSSLSILLATPVDGLDRPVHITHAGDGSGRIFVVEQTGRVRIIHNGVLKQVPFLDIAGRVSCCGERGLLSIAFPPGYAAKGRFYVNYTDKSGNTVVARYRVTADPNVADPSSERIVLTVGQPYSNHNGGQLAFGPNDGYLYIGMGDGGAGGDPENRAQNPTTLLGKLLRIDVESGDPATYVVPGTNPFRGTPGYRPEIWALGLRNPWRFSFDTETADLFIGDAGQDRIEEIDFQPASSSGGENYGWSIMEGSECFEVANCDRTGLTLPIAEYKHPSGDCASVTGGMVYRGPEYPGLYGTYLYGDYCSGHIWGLRNTASGWQNRLLYDAPFSISSFGLDGSGGLWVAKYKERPEGAIYHIAEVRATAYLPALLEPRER